MKISSRDFVLVRGSLLLLAALAGLGAAAVAAALHVAARVESDNRQALAEHGDLLARLARASTDEADIRRQTARYRELLARGIVGGERRLDWVEHIARISNELRIPDIQYEFAPQQPLDTQPLPSGHAFMASAMKLQMQLLHEADLLGFLDELAASAPAFLALRACTIERSPGNGTAPLRAECQIDWVTVQEKT